MFRSAVVRLTGWYLAIVLLISIGFSVAVYRISSAEVESGLTRQTMALRANPFFAPMMDRSEIIDLQNQQLDSAEHHLLVNLIGYNLGILMLAGVGCYWLACRTLEPIQAALEAQNRFTADASHELRTPLTAMRSEIEVALREPQLKPAEAKELLKSNLEEIKKLEQLSSGLLTLAQRQDVAANQLAPVSLAQSVEEAVERLKTVTANKKMKVHVAVSDSIMVQGESWSLSELVHILLDNAIKYSEADKQIWIKASVHGNQVRFSVRDEGVGIKASDIPFVFQRFYRADSSRSKDTVSGYGLGLSIAKQIVETHGGSIGVVSQPDKGTKFRVTLVKAAV